MSEGATNGVVFFDLGQTLGFERYRVDPDLPLEFTVYDDIPKVLGALQADGFRLGVLTAGPRWTPERVEQALRTSGLAAYFDERLTENWAADSETQFSTATDRAGGRCVFVSPNRRRRHFAKLGGMQPVPHPALALGVARGAKLAYLHATGPQLERSFLRDLCRREPVAVPLRVVTRRSGTTLYVVTTESETAAGSQDSHSTRARFVEAGLEVNSLGDADELATSDLCFVTKPSRAAGERAVRVGALSQQVVAREEGQAQVLVLQGLQTSLDIGRGSCSDGTVELPAALSLLSTDVPSPAVQYELSQADIDDLATLTPDLFHQNLTPWHESWGSLPDGYRIKSRHVTHKDNIRATTAAGQFLAGTCGSENVRLCPFDGPIQIPLSNIEADISADPTSPVHDEVVILGAHLDSIALDVSDPTTEAAPGVDDDASGVAGVLSAAHVLMEMSRRQPPRRTIRFVLFNAEEIALTGSLAYTMDRANLDRVVAMFEMDMIGNLISFPRGQLEVHTGIGDDESPHKRELKRMSSDLGDIVKRAAASVSTGLDVLQYPIARDGKDPGSSDSDHFPFTSVGCPACKICEDFYFDTPDGGRRNHRTYHSTRDTEVNEPYATEIARAAAAAVWIRANAR